jgi:hypothetical protein
MPNLIFIFSILVFKPDLRQVLDHRVGWSRLPGLTWPKKYSTGFKKNYKEVASLFFLIMVFKPSPEVNPRQVLGHRPGWLARVTRATNFFILQICKMTLFWSKFYKKKNQWVL